MALPFAVIIVLIIALIAGALALSAFIWSIRTKQFSVERLNRGALLIFDDEEPVGTPQDMMFTEKPNHGKGQVNKDAKTRRPA
ncbi:MAG: cbb3-type cytochrome oxidase assembly protein CcoS [Ignavibacteriae bacterium]|nr:cbb3-type cytochrome oxidase assembly protein CcoS [Ignavibacteriota bacterium]